MINRTRKAKLACCNRQLIANCQPGQIRGADGRCGPGIGISIPRKEMPQIMEADLNNFISFARSKGTNVDRMTILASDLSPTQSEFRQERVDAIPEEKLKTPCLVSQDDYVLDGTHRWIKHWQGDKKAEVPVLKIQLPLRQALELMKSFPEAKYVINPFVSEAQRAWMYSQKPEMAKEWESKTPKGKKLPKYKKAVRNKRNRSPSRSDPISIDPTRTINLRRPFIAKLKRKFALLKGRIARLLISQNVFDIVNNAQDYSQIGQCPNCGARYERDPESGMCAHCGKLVKQILEPRGPINDPYPNTILYNQSVASKMLDDYSTMDWDTRRKLLSSKEGVHNVWTQAARDAAIAARAAKTATQTAYQRTNELPYLGNRDARMYAGKAVTSSDRTLIPFIDGLQFRQGSHNHYEDTAKLHDQAADEHFKNGQYLAGLEHQQASQANRDAAQAIQKSYRPRMGVASERPTKNTSEDKIDEMAEDAYDEIEELGIKADLSEVKRIIAIYLLAQNEQARDERGRFAGSSIADKATDTAKAVLGKIGKSFTKFRRRYGTAGAIAITAAMLTPVPGIGFASIGVAEGIRFIAKHYSKTDNALVVNASDPSTWKSLTIDEQVAAFQQWLEDNFADLLTSDTEEELWTKYIQQGYARGAGRAFDDTKSAVRGAAIGDDKKLSFYAGTRDEFLRSSFAQPVSIERVRQLASQTFDYMEDVTADMSKAMTMTLTDGLTEGKNTRDIAKDLDDDFDMGWNRAQAIAQTEIIRAHASGQLDTLKNLGMDEVGVAVEFSNSDDDIVCPICEALEGVVFKIDEAYDVIPAHVNCRCAFMPANVGEDDEDQIDTKKGIDSAIDDAVDAGATHLEDWDISKDRPRSIFNVGPADEARDDHGRWTSSGGGELPEEQSGADLYRKAYENMGKGLTASELGKIHAHVITLKKDTLRTFATKLGLSASGKNMDIAQRIIEKLWQNHDEEREERQARGTNKPTHEEVQGIVRDIRDRWGYKGNISVVDSEGREFERGGLKWKEAGNCRLSDVWVTIWSKEQNSQNAVHRIVGHEFMHGTFEKVYQAYDADRKKLIDDPKIKDQIRASGEPNPGMEKDYPSYDRLWKFREGTTKEQFASDDGVSDYSKAYWKDYAEGKCTFHIAVHETLAEIAGHHEQTGVIIGSKLYRDYYKAVRDEYRVITGQQHARKYQERGSTTTNTDARLFMDLEKFFDADWKPCHPSEATYRRWWRRDGTNGFDLAETKG